MAVARLPIRARSLCFKMARRSRPTRPGSHTLLCSAFPRAKRKEFLPLCPEFVIEVMSPSDRLKQAKAKMEQWIGNDAQLAWLIDGDAQTVYVYRKGHAVKTHRGIAKLAGEGPVEGFVLHLSAIWKGVS